MTISTVIPKHVEEALSDASQRLSQERGPAGRELRHGRRRFGYGGRCAEQRRGSTGGSLSRSRFPATRLVDRHS